MPPEPQGVPGFPSTDPSALSGAGVFAHLAAIQGADQGQFDAMQNAAAVQALAAAMQNQPNPAAAAAVSAPGYGTPPPAAQGGSY